MKLILNIFIGIIALMLLLIFLTRIFAEPWIGKKICAKFHDKNPEYKLEIEKVHILIFDSGIEIENILISSISVQEDSLKLKDEITSATIKGIGIAKALFQKDIYIREVIISNINIKGKIPFPEKPKPPELAAFNLRIGTISFNQINLEIENTLNARAFSVKDALLKVYDLQIEKQDTLSPLLFNQFDFEAKELSSVSADSMYLFKTKGIFYSGTSKYLAVDSLFIHPNYPHYEFTSLHKYESDRIEAALSNLYVHDFSASSYFKSGRLVCSYVEIGKLDVNAFRDKRKNFQHLNRPTFQDEIYNYPGLINIDSIGILDGTISYLEHAEKANEPGIIRFNKLSARLYKITNDTIYKTEKAFLKLKAEALLMGKGKMSILLKALIFDKLNSFSVVGSLSGMEVSELNPMLEKNAFIYATSGSINKMDFHFTANNTKATGKMTFLYEGLDVTIKNKQTDDTTAIKEWVLSIIANKKIMNSNPLPGEEVRTGIIDYQRNPEKFLFNYCAKSILSGIKSSVAKQPKK